MGPAAARRGSQRSHAEHRHVGDHASEPGAPRLTRVEIIQEPARALAVGLDHQRAAAYQTALAQSLAQGSACIDVRSRTIEPREELGARRWGEPADLERDREAACAI